MALHFIDEKMLRNTFVAQVHRSLNDHGAFKSEDFEIDQYDRGPGAARLITKYRFDSSYYFDIDFGLDENENPQITVESSPGELFQKESLSFDGTTSLLVGVKAWSQRLNQELISAPIQRKIAAQQIEIDQLLESMEDLADEYFSREEGEELRRRLDALEEQLSAAAKQTIPDEKELANALDRIHNDIEDLKVQSDRLRKPGWFKLSALRALQWTKDPTNRKLLTNGAEVAKSLMLGAGSDSSSDNAI